MSWHCLQEPGGAFSAASYLDGLRCARLKLTSLPDACCCTGSSSGTCPGFPSGMTSAHSTASPGGGLSMSCPADFHARTSARPEKAQGWQGHAADCGERCTESFARFDLDSHSWKIHPCLFPEDCPQYWGTWPQQGMMRAGVCWEQTMWERHMSARESGFLLKIPTPIAHNSKEMGCPSDQRRKTPGLGTMAACGQLGTPGPLNPVWVEWLMGWPLGWTDCDASETARFRSWLRRLSGCLKSILKRIDNLEA